MNIFNMVFKQRDFHLNLKDVFSLKQRTVLYTAYLSVCEFLGKETHELGSQATKITQITNYDYMKNKNNIIIDYLDT